MSIYKAQLSLSFLISVLISVMVLSEKISPSEGLPILSGIFASWMNPPNNLKKEQS